MKISTLIFDLDGLLSDTEKLHRHAYREVLRDAGIKLSDADYERHWIRAGKGIGDFIEEQGLCADADALRRRKDARYLELVLSEAEPMPGAVSVLERFHDSRKLALATCSYRDAAYAVLRKLRIEKYFSCIATRATVERMKPYPDIFLWVARTLHVPPAECLVMEDAEKGIAAARAAGMRCVAIPNVHTRNNDFSGATAQLPNLDALTVEKMTELEKQEPPRAGC